jgi:excisionase family DNA binding protein
MPGLLKEKIRMEIPPGQRLFTMSEAMEFLRVSRSTIYRWILRGYLRGQKAGRDWRFYREDVQALLEQAKAMKGTEDHAESN